METLTFTVGKAACKAASAPRCYDFAAMERLGSVLLIVLAAIAVWLAVSGLKRA